MHVSIQQFRKSLIVITVLVLLGFLMGGIYFFLHRNMQQAPVNVIVKVSPVGTIHKPLRIERAGSVVHATMVPVYSEGAGHVSDVYVTQGQAVKAGEPLVKVEITRVEESEAIAAPVSVPNSMPRETSNAGRDVYENALKDYNRYQKLYEQGAIPRKQLESAEERLKAVQAGSQGSESSQRQQGAAVSIKRTTVVNGPVTIYAPIDGIITGSVVAVGNGIQTGQEMMALGSGQDVEIVVPLEQKELYFIQLGSQAVIKVAGQEILGQVSTIYPEVKDKDFMSFIAHLKLLQSPKEVLTPGMSATVYIATGQEVGTIVIPSQAVRHSENGQDFIFFAIEGKAVCQQVAIGEAIGDLWEVTTAIPEKGLVITNHIDQLNDGDSITISE